MCIYCKQYSTSYYYYLITTYNFFSYDWPIKGKNYALYKVLSEDAWN